VVRAGWAWTRGRSRRTTRPDSGHEHHSRRCAPSGAAWGRMVPSDLGPGRQIVVRGRNDVPRVDDRRGGLRLTLGPWIGIGGLGGREEGLIDVEVEDATAL